MKFTKSPFVALCFGILLCFLSKSHDAYSNEPTNSDHDTSALRIVALSPHLTEITFALGLGEQLVGVSDFSDYPTQTLNLPSVASYQGANIPNILRLKPTHILAWQGGNKNVDIVKLQNAGIPVYLSSINDSATLLQDIQNIANFLGEAERATDLITSLNERLNRLRERHEGEHKSYFYYLSSKPIMALGNDRWLNDLLSLCGLTNVFADSITPYPQISKAQILRKSPQIIISAESVNESQQSLEEQWQSNAKASQVSVIRANPDKLHRFTPRAIDELEAICQRAYANQ